MKTTFTTQHNAASTLNSSHAAHNVYSPLRRLTLLVTLLMTFALGARAADYVFTYTYGNNTYFLGQSTTPTTSFVPNTSIYTGNSGSTFRNANGYYIRYNNGLTFSETTGTNFTINNNQLAYDFYNGYYFYLNMNRPDKNNRAWRMSNDNNRATAYPVTTSSVINDFTISGEATIKAVGAYNYTHTNATYYDTYKFNNKTYYSTNADQAATTTEPTNNLPTITNGYTWTIESNSYATVNASTGAITVNSLPTTATEVTLTCSVSRNGVTKTATKTITLQQSGNTPTAISASDFSLAVGTDDDISYTLTGTAPIYDKVEATSGNTGIFTVVTSPTSGGKVTLHPVAMGNATLTLIAKAKDGTADACSTTVNITVAERVKTPMIEYTSNGAKALTTITCATEDATIYYTIDGSEPTTSSNRYENPFEVDEKVTVKAMAVKTGYINSIVASRTYETFRPTGIDGGVVTLNDLEDHNWAYYQQPSNLPSGYPTTYLSSPNPRNVKITYRAGGVDGASAVAISALEGEGQNEMVYYKTLEKSVPGMSGDYPYTVISNPFSKRPKKNSTYYGFAGWKIVDGGEYISEHDDGQTLGLDETIHFTNLDNNYSPNCMSGEIIFEATWTQATVKTGSSAQSFDGGSYETNFWVLSGSNNIGNITVPGNCTVSSRYPDGTVNFTRNLTGTITAGGNNAKVEFINMNSTSNVSAANKTFTMGRGIVNSGNGGQLQGCTSDNDCVQTVKVESGKYASLRNFTNGLNSARKCDQFMILGCDYDRAKGDNDKLNITGSMYVAGTTLNLNRTSGSLYVRCHIKSGKFLSSVSIDDNDGAGGTETFYLSVGNSNTQNAGRRYLCMEGGRIAGIAGGMDEASSQSTTNKSFDLRVRGTALIDGPVYGAAEYAGAKGTRTMIFTGGTVKGWIAGGANGTQSDGGKLDGASYVYVGGKTIVDSNPEESAVSNIVINRAVGGNVFGAGCGYSTGSNSGQVTLGTNVVVADDAYVERGVYGGGSYGYCTNTQISNIYITGGRVDGAAGGVNGTSYSANIPGGVYGGACQNQGGTVNIYMTGGEVNGGLYGGSNNSGTIANNVTMQINGGQVGTSSKSANIHGGGYGQNTIVSGNVDITLGATGQKTGGVTVFGDVYGGSALGKVNGTAASDSKHTYVTLNKGTINGSIYGGGLGQKNGVNNATSNIAADVYGPVAVKVYGGSVKKVGDTDGSGGVYGANNIYGAPQRSVTVDIYGTDPTPAEGQYALYAVYGGGNNADYTYGNGYPKVAVHNCENSIEYVYGGGNAAAVDATDVTIWGGDIIGNVFGGGNGESGTAADVNGNTNVKIHGGTILNVYGGSNSKGTIDGTINVKVESQAEADKALCTMNIGNVYGGGNKAASNVGKLDIVCTGDDGRINNVYGGANQANITGNIDLKINGGNIGNVFGGNNQSGDISGNVTVTVGDNPNSCGIFSVDNVYGAGNLAPYGKDGASKGNYPIVNICSGTITNSVFGGGLGKSAIVYGNPQVTIGDAVDEHIAIVGGDVYGGGDAANVVGTPIVKVANKCNTEIGNVYGGGNAADVNGTNVTIDGGKITGMVFGGGHGDKNADPQTEAKVNGNVNVDITGGTINKVFGGSNSKGNITGTIALNINKGDDSCELHIDEVYGGGNEAAGNAGTITIGCTGGEGEGIGDVYGGANAADINSGITLNITGGNISRVFGGNNTSGSINGDIAVNVNWDTENPCGVNYLGNVYGAGNQAAYTGNTEVNILNGTVTGSVYGGGLGATAVVTGTTTVNIDGSAEGHSVAVTQNVLGGGDAAAVTGSTDVNIINGAISGSVFGGGNAAGVSENGVVDVTGGTIASGVYGGSNASGTVGNTTVTLANGTIGTDAAHANVHGGGYGEDTEVSGNVAVNIKGGTIYGDVYGGSALGTVNSNTSNTTTVNLTGGIIHGDAYGGGLGDSDTAADVNGNVTVTLNGTAFTLATTTDDGGNIIPTSGRVFGCNNINGSPKGTVLVQVLNTVARDGEGNVKAKPTPNSGVYELQAVYGGGNLAAYNPTDPVADGQFTSYTYGENTVAHDNTDKPVQVVIDGCGKTSIEYVYGGGNAAATPATDVTVLGSYEIGSVFGGGNGKDKYTLDGGTTWKENLGADVGIINATAYKADNSQGKYGTGDAMTSVLGGTVHNIYGGSNTLGNIVGEATAYLDAASDCELNVDGIYGGGNEAYMDGSSGIQLGCIESLKEIYGGARKADVGGDINLTITSGHFDRVFGGNNLGGQVKGSITVNIEETGCNPITIGELYGCGNKAPYKTPGDRHPTINIRSFTSIGNVYGGGLGEDAVVEGNPTININVVKGANNAVGGWRYNGETINFDDGSKVTLPVHEMGKIGAIGNVFGGGNAAAVIGNTQVNIGTETSVDFESLTGAERTKTVEGADIRGNVYGGGNQAKVTGKTNVVIGQ